MSASTDHFVLDAVLQDLQEDGYDVFSNPRPSILPKFMNGFAPDAIAVKGTSKLAIELVSGDPASSAKVERLESLFLGHEDWKIRIVYVNPAPTNSDVHLTSPDSIDRSIEIIDELIKQRLGVAAVLQAWSTFEATARLLDPEMFSRPQSPTKLLDAMASAGHVTPDEADALRAMSKLRNRVAHGDLDADIRYNELQKIVDVTITVLDEVRRLSPQKTF